MKRFAVGSSFTLRGRPFYGIRGFEGKPTHPPLTDVPIGAYVLAFAMDVVAVIGGDRSWARDLHDAAGYTFLFGAGFSVLTTITGLADWLRMRAGSEVRRITNTHALSMLVVTALVVVNLVWRYSDGSERTGVWLAVLSGVIFLVLTAGAAIGGSLVFDKGYRVRKKPAESQTPGVETEPEA